MSTDERRARAVLEHAADAPAWDDATTNLRNLCLQVARAIRTSDEASGMVLVNRDMIQQANALLAKIMSAGHNVPGPTPEDIEDTFWRLDNVLAAATESDNG